MNSESEEVKRGFDSLINNIIANNQNASKTDVSRFSSFSETIRQAWWREVSPADKFLLLLSAIIYVLILIFIAFKGIVNSLDISLPDWLEASLNPLAITLLILLCLLVSIYAIISIIRLWKELNNPSTSFARIAKENAVSDLKLTRQLKGISPLTLNYIESRFRLTIEEFEARTKLASNFSPVVGVLYIVVFVYVYSVPITDYTVNTALAILTVLIVPGLNFIVIAFSQPLIIKCRRCLSVIEQAQAMQNRK